jgi:hypothetical protein
MNNTMENLAKLIPRTLILGGLMLIFTASAISAQTSSPKYRILIDIAHKQRFWNDPSHMNGMGKNQIDRVKYLTQQITENSSSLDAGIGYLTGEIKPENLTNCKLLFIHIPSAKYTQNEIKAITDYLRNGGALFLAMDVDYWSTLEQTAVNKIIEPFGIQFGAQSPDTVSGGHTKAGIVTSGSLKITYSEGRIVTGGTPFCWNNQTDKYPFGTFEKVTGGGKIIVMGDGMVSLYMTSWKGINDYQCSEFMHDVFKWLLN